MHLLEYKYMVATQLENYILDLDVSLELPVWAAVNRRIDIAEGIHGGTGESTLNKTEQIICEV